LSVPLKAMGLVPTLDNTSGVINSFVRGCLGSGCGSGIVFGFGGPPSLKLRRASGAACSGACFRLDVVSSREWCNKGREGVSKVSAVFAVVAVVFLCERVFRAKK
jgi:hypothetical protein